VRLVIDRDRCSGHARCNWLAPELIALDDEGFAVTPRDSVPANKVSTAEAVRENCPEGAINLVDEE
jgi:ferredoxin